MPNLYRALAVRPRDAIEATRKVPSCAPDLAKCLEPNGTIVGQVAGPRFNGRLPISASNALRCTTCYAMGSAGRSDMQLV